MAQFHVATPDGTFEVHAPDMRSAVAALRGVGAPAPSKANKVVNYALTQSWPARLAQAAFGGATLPGDVYAGKVRPTSDEAIRRSADLASFLTLGSGPFGVNPNDLRMGIKVYHGSPYKFDKFDAAKIGTGEGNAGQGYGLYFAERPDVSRYYAKGNPVAHDSRDAAIAALKDTKGYSGDVALTPLGKASWRVDSATKRAWPRKPTSGDPLGIVSKNSDGSYRFMSPTDETAGKGPGYLYSADLNAGTDDFLHWDRPLKDQPQLVRDALRTHFPDVDTSTMLGRDAYDAIASKPTQAQSWRNPFKKLDAFDQKYASDALNAAGVKGIRYLDQGSRKSGEGTFNYVLFDPDLAKILGVE